jgi:HSP20 family protein
MKLPIQRRENQSLQSEFLDTPSVVDRFFDEGFFMPEFEAMIERVTRKWNPRVDISESDKAIKLKVNVPNVDPKNIKVELQDRMLTVAGKTETEKEDKGERWYRAEREVGEFSQSLKLPESVDLSKIEANIRFGTLQVIAPKLPQSAKKQIPVSNGK